MSDTDGLYTHMLASVSAGLVIEEGTVINVEYTRKNIKTTIIRHHEFSLNSRDIDNGQPS